VGLDLVRRLASDPVVQQLPRTFLCGGSEGVVAEVTDQSCVVGVCQTQSAAEASRFVAFHLVAGEGCDVGMEMCEQIQEVAVVEGNCTSGLGSVGKVELKSEMEAMHNLVHLDTGMADLAGLEKVLACVEHVVIAYMGSVAAALVFW